MSDNFSTVCHKQVRQCCRCEQFKPEGEVKRGVCKACRESGWLGRWGAQDAMQEFRETERRRGKYGTD